MSRYGIVALTIVVTMATARTGRADQLEGLGQVVGIVELLVPDLRVEIGRDDTRLVLSAPLAFTLASPRLVEPWGVTLVGFVEPQLRVTGQYAPRGLGGGRLYVHRHAETPAPSVAPGQEPPVYDPDPGYGNAPFIELGGLVGQDGSGGFAGVGLARGDVRAGITFGVVARLVVTTEETRADFALDFQLPWNTD